MVPASKGAVPSPKFHVKFAIVPSVSWLADELNVTVNGAVVSKLMKLNTHVGGVPIAIVTVCVHVVTLPTSSVNVSCTTNAPVLVNVWFTVVPLAELPSPKVHALETIVPSGSVLDEELKITFSSISGVVGLIVNTQVGGVPNVIETVWVQVDTLPASSVTVNCTINDPTLVNVWFTVVPLAELPSPKVHFLETIDPSRSVLDEESKIAFSSIAGAEGLIVKAQVGAPPAPIVMV